MNGAPRRSAPHGFPGRAARAGARGSTFASMVPIAIALHLALAAPAPDLAPPRDPGPFQARELVAASSGAILGDLLVLGAGYSTLLLFANDTFYPSADNFRRWAYAMGASALLLPPLTAVLLAHWTREGPGSGSFWKALLLATAGQTLALGAGWATAPRFWVILPVQLVAVAAGTTVGLHWGRRAAPAASPDEARRAPAERASPEVAAGTLLAIPMCPID